jgi:hypothetical protein
MENSYHELENTWKIIISYGSEGRGREKVITRGRNSLLKLEKAADDGGEIETGASKRLNLECLKRPQGYLVIRIKFNVFN